MADSNDWKQWYTHSKWRRLRALFLRRFPLCRSCEDKGLTTEATVVDHDPPHRGDRTAFWNEKTWQPLCKQCHDYKTGKVDTPQARGMTVGARVGAAIDSVIDELRAFKPRRRRSSGGG